VAASASSERRSGSLGREARNSFTLPQSTMSGRGSCSSTQQLPCVSMPAVA
jgi:hypothetical protein